MCHHSEGSRSCQGGTNLQATIDPPRNYVSSGRQGPWRGKALSPILPAGLWSSSSGLSPWSSRNTHVLHTFTNRKHVPHQSSNSTPQLTISSRDPISSPSHPRRPATATYPTGNKQQHLPRCEVELDWCGDREPASHPRELPQQRWREEDPLAEHLRGTHQEAVCKDLDLIQHIRWTYFRAHSLVFHEEVTHDLANVFGEMAKMVGLMGTKIHPVQDQWQGKKELYVANHAAKGSAKNLHYFWVVLPVESSKIMGLKRIHSPEALKHKAGLSFCPWCGKEGQNEGTMVNHPFTGRYHLGLVCERCLLQFMTSSDRMQHHSQGCESMHVCNDEESDWSHQCYPQN